MKIKPQNPKGTRDFLPQEVAKRNYILETIRKVFRKCGYQEIETPAFERLETLSGKYGDEGDKLLFRILNSGDYLKDVPEETLSSRNSPQTTKHISDKGLRYDLTVPLARYVVQHQNELVFPFRRFHIGPVWRADRPQKGRYQEFFQCDADVIGSESLLNEVELVLMFDEVFSALRIANCELRISNRKMLAALAEKMNAGDRFTELTIAIDKLDKVSKEKVLSELEQIGFSTTQTQVLNEYLNIEGSNAEKLIALEKFFAGFQLAADGIRETRFVLSQSAIRNSHSAIILDLSLARGLNYYTGFIIEAKTNSGSLRSSIGSGGRYANLTEMFGGQNMSGVGISFGIERIYDVMEELNLFPAHLTSSSKILFVHFSETNRDYAFGMAQQLRAEGISAEVYPDVSKIQKQMKYANDKQIPFVAVCGDDEMSSQTVMLKNMHSGEQRKVAASELKTAIG